MTTQNIYDAIFAHDNYIVPFRKNAKTKTVNIINGAYHTKLVFTKTDEKTNDTNVFRTANGELVNCIRKIYLNLLPLFEDYNTTPTEILTHLSELNMVTITKDIKTFASQEVIIARKQDTHLRIFENENVIAVLFVDNGKHNPILINNEYNFFCTDGINKEYKNTPKIHFRKWNKSEGGVLVTDSIINDHNRIAKSLTGSIINDYSPIAKLITEN
jgi:hypothetical protein